MNYSNQNLFDRFKRFFKRSIGGVHLPRELEETEEKVLVHISDTPEFTYNYIFKLIKEINPEVVVHTGDLADNFKLGLGLSKKRYEKKVVPLFEKLRRIKCSEIYMVPGNHDAPEIMKKLAVKIKIKKEGSIIDIDGFKVAAAHYMERLPEQGDIKLYGHDHRVKEEPDIIYLNGIFSINIVLFPSLKIFYIPYPGGTATARNYRRLKLP